MIILCADSQMKGYMKSNLVHGVKNSAARWIEPGTTSIVSYFSQCYVGCGKGCDITLLHIN